MPDRAVGSLGPVYQRLHHASTSFALQKGTRESRRIQSHQQDTLRYEGNARRRTVMKYSRSLQPTEKLTCTYRPFAKREGVNDDANLIYLDNQTRIFNDSVQFTHQFAQVTCTGGLLQRTLFTREFTNGKRLSNNASSNFFVRCCLEQSTASTTCAHGEIPVRACSGHRLDVLFELSTNYA